MASAEEIRERLLPRRSRVTSGDLLSSGSTVLNLACTGTKEGAFKKGGIYLLVGDSSSGKSFITRTMFAEACLDSRFDGYDLIDDDPENGANMDYAAYFGEAAADRIEKRASANLEEFYDNLCGRKKPFIALLDSLDALRSVAELDKAEEDRKARAKGKKSKGSYGTGKAKANSFHLGVLNQTCVDSDSIAILICQTRDNIGLDAMFNPKTRGGGNAPTFFAQMELWTSIRERSKTEVNGKEWKTGIVARVHVKKNRQTGRDRQVLVPLYYASGLSDVDGNIRYLIDSGHWKVTNGLLNAREFGEKLSVEEFVQYVEENDCEEALAELVESVWHDIDAKTAIVRKSKYVE